MLKNRCKYFIFIIFVLFPSIALAGSECDYKKLTKLNKEAKNVTANYEVVTGDNGTESLAINVFNIPKDMYVSVTTEGYPTDTTETKAFFIPYNQTENGSYSFGVSDIDNIVKYKFSVESDVCSNFIRNFTMIKPMKNKFSTMDVCKYSEVLDYYYCKPWLTQKITDSDDKIIEKIERERIRNTKTTTTRCYSCERREKELAELARLKRIKMYVIIGISVGIVIDILIIIILVIRIRRYSL